MGAGALGKKDCGGYGMNLYNLTQNYLTVLELAENGDDLTDTLDALTDAIEDKAENTAKIIKQLEANAEMLANEIKRLSERKTSAENNAKRLKVYLQEQLEKVGKTKIKGEIFTVAIQNNPQSVDVLDERLIPSAYFIEQAPKLDRKELLAHLKSGETIPGVAVKQSRSLRIR